MLKPITELLRPHRLPHATGLLRYSSPLITFMVHLFAPPGQGGYYCFMQCLCTRNSSPSKPSFQSSHHLASSATSSKG